MNLHREGTAPGAIHKYWCVCVCVVYNDAALTSTLRAVALAVYIARCSLLAVRGMRSHGYCLARIRADFSFHVRVCSHAICSTLRHGYPPSPPPPLPFLALCSSEPHAVYAIKRSRTHTHTDTHSRACLRLIQVQLKSVPFG